VTFDAWDLDVTDVRIIDSGSAMKMEESGQYVYLANMPGEGTPLEFQLSSANEKGQALTAWLPANLKAN